MTSPKPTWSTACPDWATRIEEGLSIIPPPIFPAEAEAGLKVLRDLRMVDVEGTPRMGDACGKWLLDFAACVFGAYDRANNRQLITEFFLMVPKKNYKSGLAAGVMLTTLIRNTRHSAEFTIIAPTIEVADNAFEPARDTCEWKGEDDEDDPDAPPENRLNALMHIQQHTRKITHRVTKSKLRVVAAAARTAGGKKSTAVLVEELWLFGKRADAKALLREATGGLASRPEGFVIYVTTQSDEPPAGVFKEKLQYARDVRDGKIVDPSFLPVIYEHPPDIIESKGYMKLENLAMVNPNLGYSVDPAFLEQKFRQAETEGEGSLREFLAKHGNVQIGMNLRDDRWRGADRWESAGDRSLTWAEFKRRSEVVTVGIDGGGLDDLLGLAMIGRERGTGRELHWAHAWAHEIALEQRKSIASQLRDFEKLGQLTVVAKPGDDVVELANKIVEIRDAGLLPEKDAIGVDAAGIGAIVKVLVKLGFTLDQIKAVSQGWRLNGAIKDLERFIAGGDFVHAGTEMMAWVVSNARTVLVGNAVSITKQASGTGKIDPLMATLNAQTLMSLEPQAKRTGKLVLAVVG